MAKKYAVSIVAPNIGADKQVTPTHHILVVLEAEDAVSAEVVARIMLSVSIKESDRDNGQIHILTQEI